MVGDFGLMRRGAPLAVLAVAAFSLAGCFDLHFDVALKNDGSGSIEAKMAMSKDMTDLLEKDKNADKKKKDISVLVKNNQDVSVQSKVEDGRYITTETKSFKSLSDVSLGESKLEVIDLGRSLFAVANSRIRWVAQPETGKKGDKAKKSKSRSKMMMGFFKGHVYSLTMHLPCNVTKAGTTAFGDAKMKPVIEKSWNNTSTVRWEVPLDEVLAAADDAPPSFEAECWSFYGIKPGKTK